MVTLQCLYVLWQNSLVDQILCLHNVELAMTRTLHTTVAHTSLAQSMLLSTTDQEHT